jgi:serine O-acetyltransferase
MTEISVVAQEIAASGQRGVLADEGKLWEKLRLDAERVAAGEEMLRGFLDLVVLHHDGFPSALGLLLARKLAEYSMRAEQWDEIARAAMAGDPGSSPPRSPTWSPFGRETLRQKLFEAVSVL